APDSQIGISQFRSIFGFNQLWTWEESGLDLGAIWQARDYDDSWWCGQPAAPGIFYFGLTPIAACDGGERLTNLRYGPQTYYFRTHFNVPSTTGRATLTLIHVFNDGAIVYLNG